MPIQEMLKTIESIPYRPKGIFPSELCLLVLFCQENGIDTVLESGVLNGHSTKLLRALLPDVKMVSFEKNPSDQAIAEFGNDLIVGDSFEAIPEWIHQNNPERVAVLIDGPKGLLALKLKENLIKMDCIKVVGIHDLPRGYGETLHSHDVHGPKAIKFDASVPPEWREKYPKGPGIAVWSLDHAF